MNKKIYSVVVLIILISFLIPSFALAAWWNPFSWGIWNRIFHFQKQVQVEKKLEKVDETANWKTYKNTQYGFEFKYPANATVNDKDCCQGVMIADIEIYPANETYANTDLMKAVGLQLYDRNKVDWSDWPLASDNNATAKSIKLGNLLMHITVGGSGVYKDFFDAVVSTFKFIPVDETVNWKTYNENGIFFKYPSEMGIPKTSKLSTSVTVDFKNSVSLSLGVRYNQNLGRNMTMDELVNEIENNPDKSMREISDFVVDGKSGKKLVYMNNISGGGEEMIIVPSLDRGGNILIGYDYGRAIGIEGGVGVEKILSTFKFISLNDETVNWKIYADNVGFQVRYPDDKEINTPKSQLISCNNSCPDTQVVDGIQAKLKREIVNGVDYCIYEGGDCGMGTCLHDFLYVVVRNGKCYGLDMSYYSHNCGAVGGPGDENSLYKACLAREKAKAEDFKKSLSMIKFITSPVLEVPVKVGECVKTTVSKIGTRLQDGSTGKDVPGSGSQIRYANGIMGVSYGTIEGVDNSKIGDEITLCLMSIPQNCPPGDSRGKVYKATNTRTGEVWSLPDSEHFCGGA